MNERIADLLEQAFDRCKKYDDEGKTGLVKTTEALSIFAEMIVRECVDKMESEDSFYGQWMGRVIKEHFGVEE